MRVCRVRLLEGKESWGSCTTPKSAPNSLAPNFSGSGKRMSLRLFGGAVRATRVSRPVSSNKRPRERSGSGPAGFMGWQPGPAALGVGWLLQRRAE